MTMRHAVAASAAAVLLLAGCSSKTSTSAAAGDAQPQEPTNLETNPYVEAIPVTAPSPAAITAIPARFQGRWGLVGMDCIPANAAIAKGLMTIEGNRLSFYESRGTATHLRQLTPSTIAFDLPMSGEGKQWAEPTRLTLQDGGRVVVRQATGPKDRTGGFTYQRCPA